MKNRTLLFGEGLFETFRVYRGKKLSFVEDHLDRMAQGCRFFQLPFSRLRAMEALGGAALHIPNDVEGRLRLNLRSYGESDAEKTSFEISWEPIFPPPEEKETTVRLGLAPFRRFSDSPLVRFKTTSYLENIFVFRWARKQGFFDALFTNERGEITEGSITNIFFVNHSGIFTPPVEAGLLPGITRKQVIEVCRKLGIPLTVSMIVPSDLKGFVGAFVTNSVIEILPVQRVGETDYGTPETIVAVYDAYRNHLKKSLFSL